MMSPATGLPSLLLPLEEPLLPLYEPLLPPGMMMTPDDVDLDEEPLLDVERELLPDDVDRELLPDDVERELPPPRNELPPPGRAMATWASRNTNMRATSACLPRRFIDRPPSPSPAHLAIR
jgi:hypothetical protein